MSTLSESYKSSSSASENDTLSSPSLTSEDESIDQEAPPEPCFQAENNGSSQSPKNCRLGNRWAVAKKKYTKTRSSINKRSKSVAQKTSTITTQQSKNSPKRILISRNTGVEYPSNFTDINSNLCWRRVTKKPPMTSSSSTVSFELEETSSSGSNRRRMGLPNFNEQAALSHASTTDCPGSSPQTEGFAPRSAHPLDLRVGTVDPPPSKLTDVSASSQNGHELAENNATVLDLSVRREDPDTPHIEKPITLGLKTDESAMDSALRSDDLSDCIIISYPQKDWPVIIDLTLDDSDTEAQPKTATKQTQTEPLIAAKPTNKPKNKPKKNLFDTYRKPTSPVSCSSSSESPPLKKARKRPSIFTTIFLERFGKPSDSDSYEPPPKRFPNHVLNSDRRMRPNTTRQFSISGPRKISYADCMGFSSDFSVNRGYLHENSKYCCRESAEERSKKLLKPAGNMSPIYISSSEGDDDGKENVDVANKDCMPKKSE